MKIYQFLAFLLLINFIICQSITSYCKSNAQTANPTKVDDCTSNKDNGGYCCFLKDITGNSCLNVGPNYYKHIPEQVKFGKKCTVNTGPDCVEYKDYSIDCKSSYLAYSILSLILIFL